MKRFSKILCAVLVIAVLCTSLLFITTGAEETYAVDKSDLLDGYTAEALTKEDGSKVTDAVKSDVAGNLLSYTTISSTGGKGDEIEWGNPGGRGSEIITNTATGESMYGEFYIPDGTDVKTFQANGNDYIQFNFEKVDNTKVAGNNQYVVVDFDFAYEGVLDGIKFEVITRGSGAYWANVQQFKNLVTTPNKFVHITAVYNYQDGSSIFFVNGAHVSTIANGALTAAGLSDRNNGVTMGTSELRIGSNSTSTFYLDNVCIRNFVNAEDSDDLADAIASGSTAGWSGNIYTADYTLPSIPYFVKSFGVTPFASNSVTNSGVYYNPDSNVTYIATGNATDSPFITIGTAGQDDPYLIAYCNTTTSYKGSANNLFFNANVPNTDPFTVIGEGAVGYYVVDFDVATHGNYLPEFDVSVVMRRDSDKAGYPFSDEIYISSFVTASDEWAHVTIVGDIANNVAKVFINGEYVGDGGKAVRNDPADSNKLGSDTQVVAQGFRVELTRNNIQTDMTAGDNVAFDNFSHRLYVTDNYAALTEALADNDLTDWEDNLAGRAGEKLPVIAIVNGVEYVNAKELQAALFSNETLTVEFLGQPLAPVLLHANCTINTHGMPLADLVTLDKGCEVISTSGNTVTIKAPYAANETMVKTDKTTVINLVKSDVEGNLLSTSSIFSEYYKDNGKGRVQYLVTNVATGEQYVRDTVDVNAPLDTNNVYIDWKVDGKDSRIDYELGVDQFIVFDIDFALHSIGEKYEVAANTYVTNEINLNPITRNSSNGGVWGNNNGEYIKILTQAGVGVGEFVHLTAVLSPDTCNMDVFINGVHVTTIEKAISSATGNNFSSMRMFSSCTSTANFDNVSIRNIKSSELTSAVAAKNITAWSGNVYTAEYKLPEIAPIATVNGVDYYIADQLAKALVGNDKVEVELLHAFSEKVVVSCPAVINTNSMDHNFVTCEGGSVTADGAVLTFTAPYVTNDHGVVEELGVNMTTDANGNPYNNTTIQSGNALFDAVHYSAEDNLFSKINYCCYQYDNFRGAYLVSDPISGNKYIYDTVYSGDPAGKNTYQNWFFSGDVASSSKGYTLGVNQYLVMDFDMAFDAYANTNLNFTTRDSANTNIAGTGFHINEAMAKAGIGAGHFAHITILAEVDTNTVYVYVNGVKQLTVANGITRLTMTEGYWLDGVRLLQNLSTSVKFDNLYFRVTEDATLAGLNTLVGHSINIYTDSYELPSLPKFATIDGVDYYSAAEVSAALRGNVDTPKQVEFFHIAEGTVNVACDAVLITHGMNISLDYYKIGTVTDKGDGVYEFDCGYVSSTNVENVTSTSVFGSAVLVSGNNNIISGIHFDQTGTYMNRTWLDEMGNTVYGMHTYLISTDGMDNVYGMIARPEGTSGVIGDKYYEIKDGALVEAGVSGTYINLNHSNPAFTYSASENNYWVYDFDILIEGEALNIHPYALIKTKDGGFQYGTFDLPLGEYVLENGNKGKFNHVTIVADYNNNLEYIFINDVFVATSPLMAEQAPETAYVEGASYNHHGLRLSLGTRDYSDNASLAIDNVLARKFVTSNSDNLADAMTQQDITLWTGRYAYTLPETPDLGTVNGVMYNNVGDLEAAIAANENSDVVLVRPIRGAISIDGVATIETNGFAEAVAAKLDGFYEFDAGRYGTVKASRKYIVTNDGTVYTSRLITGANYANYSTLVTFYTTIGGSTATKEVYAFLYGDQIVAPDLSELVSNPLGVIVWATDKNGENIVEAGIFPIASGELGNIAYYAFEEQKHIDINTMGSLTVDTEFIFTIYVEVTEENGVVAVGKETVVIDGVTYLVFTKKLAANELNSLVEFEYIVNYKNGDTYIQVNQIASHTVAEYAAKLFASDESDADKTLLYAALAYSNAAYVVLNGEANAEFTALLADNAAYAPAAAELGDALDTSALVGAIRSVALKLDSAPSFVFKVAKGFIGTINFKHNDVVISHNINAAAGEQLVVVDGFKVYNIHNDITVEIVVNGEIVATGAYNLATYAHKTVAADNTFATALLTYATVAESYLTPAEPPHEHNFVEGKCECGAEDPNYVPPTGIQYTEITKDQVTSTTLTTVVESKIKQMDQGTEGTSNGYFTKEGGTAKYVLAMKDGAQVEGLYFSRSVPWAFLEGTVDRGTENSGYSEHRYALDKTTVITSISFDYIIDGTCGEHEDHGEGVFQIRLADGATYVNTVYGNDTFVEDGQWHTFTWENTDSQLIDLFLFKLYAFQGEFVIANLVINYAA